MKAHVVVSLKKEVLDPQGDAVRRALESLGFNGVRSVRVGKLIEIEMDDTGAIEMDDTGAEEVRQKLQSMSQKLLCNPVIEDFHVEIRDSNS